ncbi:MAG: TIGR03013 family PEP-CTERM/XrtA system glycosyltransferase [Proteobacteria bacterium]|nr:TIGR03013 family PEP-CTERM/XrtA system glycosyltransferase [Pseudomonadota bacterium]
MIRVFNHYFHRRTVLHIVLDFGLLVTILGAVVLAEMERSSMLAPLAATGGLSLAACLFVINSASGFYQHAHNRSFHQSCARALVALMLALPIAYGIFSLFPGGVAGVVTLKVAAMIGVAAVVAHRVYAAHSVAQSSIRSRVLIFGSGTAAQLVGRTILAEDPHADVLGYVVGPNEPQPVAPTHQLLRCDRSLTELARELGADEIVVALAERRGGSMPLRDLLDCKLHGIRVVDTATYFEKTMSQIRVDYANAGWLVFGEGFRQGLMRTFAKRVFDILCAGLLLLLAAPLMLLTVLLIKLESPGPALYRQTRTGRNNVPFDVIKFRSMRADAEKDGKPQWAAVGDSRVTRVGNVMRKYRIDELPQLFNVLKGEMSLVGPRPERPFFVEQLTESIPYYAVRHSVKPGVTGWAQVRYHYGSTLEDSQEKLQYDLYYVKNHTLFLDLVILFETVAVVLTGKGAR